jgi:hypothetical protein
LSGKLLGHRLQPRPRFVALLPGHALVRQKGKRDARRRDIYAVGLRDDGVVEERLRRLELRE